MSSRWHRQISTANQIKSSIFTDPTQTVRASMCCLRASVLVSEYFSFNALKWQCKSFQWNNITSTTESLIMIMLWLNCVWSSFYNTQIALHIHSFIECWIWLLLLLITFIFSCYEKCLRNVCSQDAEEEKIRAHSVGRKYTRRSRYTWNAIKISIVTFEWCMKVRCIQASSLHFPHPLSPLK